MNRLAGLLAGLACWRAVFLQQTSHQVVIMEDSDTDDSVIDKDYKPSSDESDEEKESLQGNAILF